MATMNISLPDSMKLWVEGRARSERYANASDYIRDLIRRDQNREANVCDLQVLLEEGLDSGTAAPFDMEIYLNDRPPEPR